MKKTTLWRAGLYAAGAVILALGAALGTKTGLGISPSTSVPFSLKSAFGIDFAMANFCVYCVMIAIQLIIRGKNRRWQDLLQLPFSFVFSALLGLFDGLIEVPELLWQRLAVMAVSIVLIGLGVCLMVNMRILPNPPDGLANALGWAIKKDLGLAKNILDFSCVVISFLVDVLFGTIWSSIGVGTVIFTVFIGRSVHLFNRLLKVRILSLAGLEKEY
jgi:uncharacterized membrane protein YczE